MKLIITKGREECHVSKQCTSIERIETDYDDQHSNDDDEEEEANTKHRSVTHT